MSALLRDPEVVYIGFSTPRSWNPVSALIRAFSESEVSHAFWIAYSPLFEEWVVIEATEVGFRDTPLWRFRMTNDLQWVVKPLRDIRQGFVKVAQNHLGDRFDFEGLFGMPFVEAGKALKKPWKNPFRSSTHVFCSEGVLLSLVPQYGPLDPEQSPQFVLDLFRSREPDSVWPFQNTQFVELSESRVK